MTHPLSMPEPSVALGPAIARVHAAVGKDFLGWVLREKQTPTRQGILTTWDRHDPSVTRAPYRADNPTRGYRDPRWKPLPHFLTTISACDIIFDRAIEQGLQVELYYLPASERWTCRIGSGEASAPASRKSAAITIAAIRAVGGRGEADVLEAFDIT